MLTELDAHAYTADPEPFAGPDHPIRKITRLMAFGGEWRAQNAENMAALFDGLAPEWSGRHDETIKTAPVIDGLDRGQVGFGRWLELGSGTGAGTRVLSPRADSLVCADLSFGMLSHAPEIAPRVNADASTLPFVADSFDGVLMVNMLLLPHEVDRVLAPQGSLLWVNTLGDQTPIHLPAADVLEAMPGEWHGRTARAGTGFWLSAQRAEQR